MSLLTPLIQSYLLSIISKNKEILADLVAVKTTKLCNEYIELLYIVRNNYIKNINKFKPSKIFRSLYFFDIETHPPIEKRIEIIKKSCGIK